MARRRVASGPSLVVDVDVTGVAELPELSARALLLGMRRGMNLIRQLARRNASGAVLQRRSGRLASHMRAQARRQGEVVVGRVWNDLFYGRLQEYGAGPHVIRPRTAKLLGNRRTPAKALAAGGRFWTRVNHPGVRPRPWFRPAVEEGLPKVAALIEEELITAVAREALARG